MGMLLITCDTLIRPCLLRDRIELVAVHLRLTLKSILKSMKYTEHIGVRLTSRVLLPTQTVLAWMKWLWNVLFGSQLKAAGTILFLALLLANWLGYV